MLELITIEDGTSRGIEQLCIEGMVMSTDNRLNKVKKFINVKNKDLILLAVYKKYRLELLELDEALEFVSKMMEWEEKEENELSNKEIL